MKLCIVTGIFEPESGGPATYTPKLAHELVGMGHQVTVVTYSAAADSGASYSFRLVRVVRGNKILNRVRFFFAVLPHIARSDAVYMLDYFAAGFPAAIASRLLGRPYAVRIGGDYLWEHHTDKEAMPLSDFYAQGLQKQKEYASYASAISWVLLGATHVVFNAERLRLLYIEYWHVPQSGSSVIENPVPKLEVAPVRRTQADREFVFWGRVVAIKNIESLIRAFARAKVPLDYSLAIIGDGPRKAAIEQLIVESGLAARVRMLPAMPLHEVLERVKNARAFVLPSWTDISPNQVYEALAIGLPSLVTKENYLGIAQQLPRTIDPRSVEDIALSLEELADDTSYENFSDAFRAIRIDRTWSDVARSHHALFTSMV